MFNGVIPESVLQRCAELASCVEGRLWRLDQKCPSRDELEIYAALDHLFRAITLATSSDVTPVGVSQPSGAAPGVPKRMRAWIPIDVSEVHPPFPQLGGKKIYMAHRDYDLGKLEVCKGGNGGRTKVAGAQEAVNCQEMPKKLAAVLESAAIIPFNSEYMGIDRTPATGFAMEDVCLAYEPRKSDLRNGRITAHVTKNASRNIYTYIEAPKREDMRRFSRPRGKTHGEQISR